MKKLGFFVDLVILAVFLVAPNAKAHFQGLIPSDDMVTKSESKIISLDVAFFHPWIGGEGSEIRTSRGREEGFPGEKGRGKRDLTGTVEPP